MILYHSINLCNILAVKRRYTKAQLVQQAAKWPPVGPSVMPLATEDLGGEEFRRADDGVGPIIDDFGETKIHDL